jgi:hypothetical protein
MSDQKTGALRAIPVERADAPIAPAPSRSEATPAPDAAARSSGATTSSLRPWRSTPRPTGWQPGTWGDAL